MRNPLDFYLHHYADMLQPLLNLARHGVRVDTAYAATMRTTLLAQCTDIQTTLSGLAGAHDCTCGHHTTTHTLLTVPLVLTKAGTPKKRQPPSTFVCGSCECKNFTPRGKPLHAKVDLSSTRIVTFLYDYFGFPKQRKRGEENPTGDEIAVRRLIIKAKKWLDEAHTRVPADAALWKRQPQQAIDACQLILEHREKFKTASFLNETKVDEDDRLRCQYRFTTETGRLSSKSNPYGSGINLQNVHRGVRSCFIPDDGCFFLEGDLSQAESRVVYALTADPALTAKAQSKPWEYDTHTHNAAMIFNIPVAQVTKEQRYLGKRAIHAGHYGMHGKRLSEAFLLDGIVRTPDECQTMIDAYFTACPAILTWQATVRKTIMRTGTLTTSWGRTLSFAGERLNDDTYRRGYAFQPQSEIGDLLNQWGLVPVWRWLKRERMQSHINCQIHDALLISVTPDEAYDVATFMADTLERSRHYNTIPLSIPVEFSLGRSWVKEREIKQLPDRYTFNATVRDLLRTERKAA
jgi:hypothetical protein